MEFHCQHEFPDKDKSQADMEKAATHVYTIVLKRYVDFLSNVINTTFVANLPQGYQGYCQFVDPQLDSNDDVHKEA